jgi:hypothetical protein
MRRNASWLGVINGGGSRRIFQSPILLSMFGCKKADESVFKQAEKLRAFTTQYDKLTPTIAHRSALPAVSCDAFNGPGPQMSI